MIKLKLPPYPYRTLFLLYTVVLVLLAVLPINSSGSALNNTFVVHIRLDYLLHFAVFIPWVVLLRMYSGTSFRSEAWKTLLLVLAGIAFAAANEAVQYFLPYRAFNINDLVANGVGVGIGAVAFLR